MRTCTVDGKPGYFHRWIDFAEIVAPGVTIGSHPGGQIMETRAIVELEDGTVELPYPNKVKFTDSATYHTHELTIGGRMIGGAPLSGDLTQEQIAEIRKWVNNGVTPYIKGRGSEMVSGYLEFVGDAFSYTKRMLDEIDRLREELRVAILRRGR